MAKKRYYDGEGMISEDRNAMANLPQNVVIKEYPSTSGYLPENLNDGLSGIDEQMRLDNSKKSGGFKPKKV